MHVELDASVSDAQCLNVHFRSCTFFRFAKKSKFQLALKKCLQVTRAILYAAF